ncbi:hypothetical protein WN943_019013 [Citrus x changshan-huyou]
MEVERGVQANIGSLSHSNEQVEPEAAVRTCHNGTVSEIPTIDLNDPDQERLTGAIAEASQEWGIFQVINHGIPSELINKLQGVGREFFELPQEEKEAYARPRDAKDIEGYGTRLQKEAEEKKSWVDHIFHRIWPPASRNYRFWPKNPPSYREVNEYANCMRGVVNKLFRCLSLGLGVEGHALKEAVGGDELEYMLKINYYPPCPRPDLAPGLVPHTDLSSITILVPNDVPGLLAFKGDRSIDVNYIPNALIVTIGDQIEILSNGKYKAVLHKATPHKEKTRISWPVFLDPPADMVVGPLPQLVNGKNPPKYEAKKYKDYVHFKLDELNKKWLLF